MRTHKMLLFSGLCSLAIGTGVAFGEGRNLGRPMVPADMAPWDIDIEPAAQACPRAAEHPTRAPRSLRITAPPVTAMAEGARRRRRAVLPPLRPWSAT